jgi:sugar phosphate isomerase/epimerase
MNLPRKSLVLQIAVVIVLFLYSTIQGLSQSKTKKSKGDPSNWKLGLALYTFSNMSFPQQLDYADSAGIKYVEGFTFAKAGIELKDSLLMNLSPSGVQQLKAKLNQKGFKMESIYITGGKTVDNWKRDFEFAKRFGVKYVTAEPPKNMWDSVDSLAKAYSIKVALHNHWNGNSIYWHPDSVLAAIAGHSSFGACPDLGHYPKSGLNPLDAIKKLEGKIIGIHLKDIAAYNNTKIQDVPVGTGVIDFPAIFDELKRQDFRGNINIERDTKEKPNNLSSVKQTVKYYREILSL